eukprot:TRINITY_DN2894_c0_g1_i1.p1 TRINITY_DN2894_c0_g1~~TRINITY_DN2894_c0_g1_i1.p1  ORF type:complete len:175 (-),score=26.72 TRINITY_DN2894_c0_g1_i1:37-561(-)
MYLRKRRVSAPVQVNTQDFSAQKLNERSMAYACCDDMYLNLQFMESNDGTIESQISNVINDDDHVKSGVLSTSLSEHIDIYFRIFPGHAKLTWISVSLAPGGESGLDGLVFFYADQENLQEDTYPVCYFSMAPGSDCIHVPIKSSKYGSIIKLKIIRGGSHGLRISNISFKGRK